VAKNDKKTPLFQDGVSISTFIKRLFNDEFFDMGDVFNFNLQNINPGGKLTDINKLVLCNDLLTLTP